MVDIKANYLVSIVITTYGRTEFLEKAIQSVIVQSYPNIEIIVVDDNAKKMDVRKQVEKIVEKYPMIRLIQNNENLGGSLSRNVGIKASQGDFISFLDDDDTYKPERVQKYINAYEQNCMNNIGIIYSFVDVVDVENNKIGEYRITPMQKPLYQHMISCIAATSQWMVPSYIFDKVGIFEKAPCKQDSIMLLKILGAGYNPLCVEECLGNYTEHNLGRISGVSKNNVDGMSMYRNWSRKYYDQLTEAEIRNVEISFASQLLTLNVLLDEKKAAYCELKTILKNNMFSVIAMKGLLKCIVGKRYIEFFRKKQEIK